MKRLLLLLIVIALLVLPMLTVAAGQPTKVKDYDPEDGLFPEGIAIDKRGNIFVSLLDPPNPDSIYPGEIWRIAPDGSETMLHQFAVGTMPAGLAVDAEGNLYVCVIVGIPEELGVWRISPDGYAERLPGTNNISWANALAFDKRGNLYVTSSYAGDGAAPLGAIWRIPPGGAAEPWLVDAEFLGGVGQIPGYPPLGANGISFRHNTLYVANTEKALIARIPILPDGSPGEPGLVVQAMPELYVIDGLALDVHGIIYAALVGQDRIVSVDPATGAIEELAGPGDGVDGPSSLAFGTGKGDKKSLFFVNYAYPFELDSHPGVLKMGVGVPGLPLP